LGLSSISHSERHVLANVENILHFLHLSKGTAFKGRYAFGEHPVNFMESQKVLRKNTKRLLRVNKNSRNTSIMVTLSLDAVNYQKVKALIVAGMEIARINGSHDNEQIWMKMVENVRQAALETQCNCSVYFDLAGPKLRTGAIGETKKKKKPGNHIKLFQGDLLHLYRQKIIGKSATKSKTKVPLENAKISCSIPEIFDDVRIGENIWFDDGKLGGKIIQIKKQYLVIEVTKANPKGSKLRAEKGINLPDTDLHLPSLTKDDLAQLPFICQYADIVGYSFVRKPSDVRQLQDELKKLNCSDLGLVLKIENKEAFNNLPALILQGMESPSLGVMTARGDLSVELGAERLSEVQEQILWLCEAALIPNIWATQVLETLAKRGITARAEITDAAMSVRSECVMLNKGKYILEAVRTLINILDRMEQHQYKKQGTLRLLKVADNFFKQYSKHQK
jgi:pyruvate kinase